MKSGKDRWRSTNSTEYLVLCIWECIWLCICASICVFLCVCICSCEYVRYFIWVICKYIFRGTNSIWFIHHSISKHVNEVGKSTCALNANNNNKHSQPMCTFYHRQKIKLGKKGEQKSIELHEIICASKTSLSCLFLSNEQTSTTKHTQRHDKS